MANTVYQVKRTSVASRQPNTTSAGNLQYIPAGGLALNMTDQILYSSDGTNLIYVGSNQFNLSVTNILTTKAISANGSNGTAGQVLYSNGTSTYWNDPAGGPGGSPGGSNTWVQFNDSTAFGATAGFTFDKDTNNATIANNLLVGVGVNSAAFTVGTATVANTTGVFTEGTMNAVSYTVGTGTIANSVGVYTGVVNGTSITVGTDVVSNSTGVFATGTVNAASHTVGTSTVANSTGVYTGIVNGSTLSVGTAFTANSTLVNAIGYSISTTFIANTLGLYHTGTVNAASHTVGTSTVANSLGVYTDTVNAASHTVGTSTVANATGLYTTGTVNAASHTVGTVFTVNSTIMNVSSLQVYANGSLGSQGQCLTSNGATGGVFWSTPSGGMQPRAITIIDPVSTDSMTVFCAPSALTLSRVRAVVRGTTPSVTLSVYSAADRTATTTTHISANIVSNTTNGNTWTSFTSTSISSNTWLYVTLSSVTGTVNELHLTFEFV